MVSSFDVESTEIKAMDKWSLSFNETKALLKEMRLMKKPVIHAHGKTGYVSGGLIILL